MRRFRTSSISRDEFHKGQHRFEHWYLDNCVYFITARCKDRASMFAPEEAKCVFWDRFDHWTSQHGYVPWITSLLNNHYHTLGYLREGEQLGPMMQHFHGSVAKLVNDLHVERLKPFWYDSGKQGYFDGCIRDAVQARRAYRYIMLQSVRHGLARDWREYPHTRVNVEIERAIARAGEKRALLEHVKYKRYERGG